MKLRFSPLYSLTGPLIWCIWFVALYGGLSVLCVRVANAGASGPGWVNLVLGLLTLLAVLTLSVLAWRSLQELRQFREADDTRLYLWLALAGQLVSALAVVAVGLPVVYLPPCL